MGLVAQATEVFPRTITPAGNSVGSTPPLVATTAGWN